MYVSHACKLAAGMTFSACSSGVIDIVCGTLQAKLFTKDLSSGSSRCIQYGSLLLSPCNFQRQVGKVAACNWKNTIRHLDQPLARVLESFTAPDGKRYCHFVGRSVASTLGNPTTAVLVPSNSRPCGSSTMNNGSTITLKPSPSQEESTGVSPQAPGLASDPLELPVYQPVASLYFHWVQSTLQILSFH